MVVYSSGFEPELDGVGGRNVIQLHHEYLIFKSRTFDMRKKISGDNPQDRIAPLFLLRFIPLP